MSVIIGEVAKGNSQKIIVATNEYKGKEYVDVRLHYAGEDGEFYPTKKGITLTSEVIPEIIKMINKGAKELK